MLSNVQSQYRKVAQIKIRKICIFIFPAFFEPVSAALLLQEMAVVAPVWVMIQLESLLMPLLATVLRLINHFNQCLPK